MRKRGTRPGLPDVLVIYRGHPVFCEVKSISGRATRVQKQVRAELLAVGCRWWMVRSARAGLEALRRSGVEFSRPPIEPNLQAWEGPFDGSERRLTQHPTVASKQREYMRRWLDRRRAEGQPEELRLRRLEYTRRWRERKRARAIEGAAARDDAAQPATRRAE